MRVSWSILFEASPLTAGRGPTACAVIAGIPIRGSRMTTIRPRMTKRRKSRRLRLRQRARWRWLRRRAARRSETRRYRKTGATERRGYPRPTPLRWRGFEAPTDDDAESGVAGLRVKRGRWRLLGESHAGCLANQAP